MTDKINAKMKLKIGPAAITEILAQTDLLLKLFSFLEYQTKKIPYQLGNHSNR